MASWVDFLKDSNNDIVYPAGITSGVFLPNGIKLSSWMKEIEKSIESIGDYVIITVNPSEWVVQNHPLDMSQTLYIATSFGVLTESFKNATFQKDDSSSSVEPDHLIKKYIWLPYIRTEGIKPLENDYISNANKYILDVTLDGYSVNLIAKKRPPYKTCIKIVNLSSNPQLGMEV